MSRGCRAGRTIWILCALLGASHAARADDDQRRSAVPLHPTYTQECAACHVAFPPALLPADSWRRVMNGLSRHYGTDASLDAATVKELSTWLGANAGSARRLGAAPPEDRVTKSAWFVRKHDEVPAAAWQRPAVRSAANCTACHANAARGEFDEHAVRIPR